MRVAIVGATGAVGSTMLGVMRERAFPADEVVADGAAERRLADDVAAEADRRRIDLADDAAMHEVDAVDDAHRLRGNEVAANDANARARHTL